MLVIELTGGDAPASVPGGAIHELALDQGISSARARRLRVMIDELVTLAQSREHGDRPAEVRVRAWSESGHLHVEVSDRGIPVFQDDTVLPHELVRLGFAEFIELKSHGPDGNTARCSLHISDNDARHHLSRTEKILSPDAPEIEASGDFPVRAMRADECGGLARLAYRCYGYNYPAEEIYFPEQIASLIEGGLMHSAAVFDEAGEPIGHASLTKADAESRIAEAGKMIVDPRYRSHGLAKKLAQFRLQRASEIDLLGLWTECVSNHPYSQQNQLKMGARETGVFLAMLPTTVQMVGIETPSEERGSLVPMYLPLPGSPPRILHAPSRYAETLREILGHLAIEREIELDADLPSKPARMSVSVHRLMNIAVIGVESTGSDFLEQIETQMEHLQDMRISAVYLDLPLSDPGTTQVGDHLAGFGFFFSALLPESARDGDTLRLQSLNHEHISAENIHLASEWGKRILEICLQDRDRVSDSLRQARLAVD